MGDTYTIQISSDLIRRLTNDEAKTKMYKKAKPKASKEHKPQPQRQPKPEASRSLAGKWPLEPPRFFPLSPPPSPATADLEAIRSVLQESERVVEKLEKQEADMVQELTQRAKELREKDFKLPYQKPMPCLNEREACLQCYKEHLNDPLKCASAVKMFTHCVRQARQQAGRN